MFFGDMGFTHNTLYAQAQTAPATTYALKDELLFTIGTTYSRSKNRPNVFPFWKE